MFDGPLRLSALASLLAFGATGIALALTGAGLPFVLAAVLGAVAVGLVMFAALRRIPAPPVDRGAEMAAMADLDRFRTETATLRHDLRGVLSPALMMTDRLIKHADPAVQRAGNAVLRSIDRATALLAANRDTLQTAAPERAAATTLAGGAGPRAG